MIHEVVVLGFGVGRCGEVHAVRFARLFNRVVITRETHQPGMEIYTLSSPSLEMILTLHIFPHLLDRISRRIDADEYRQHIRFTDHVDRDTHLIQLLWTDVRAVGETEIDERPFPEDIGIGEGLVGVGEEGERTADRGFANGFVYRFLAYHGERQCQFKSLVLYRYTKQVRD